MFRRAMRRTSREPQRRHRLLAEVVSFAQHLLTDPATLIVGLGANGTACSKTGVALLSQRCGHSLSTGEGVYGCDRPQEQSAGFGMSRLHGMASSLFASAPMGATLRAAADFLPASAYHRSCTGRARRLAGRRSMAAGSSAHLEHRDRHLPSMAAASGLQMVRLLRVVLERHRRKLLAGPQNSGFCASTNPCPLRSAAPAGGLCRAPATASQNALALGTALRGHGRKPRWRRQLWRPSLFDDRCQHRNRTQPRGLDSGGVRRSATIPEASTLERSIYPPLLWTRTIRPVARSTSR